MRFLHVTDTHQIDDNTEKIHRDFWKEVRAKESFDAILHTGDFGRTELEHVLKAFQVIREENGTTPVYAVLGNHDLWSTRGSLSLETRLDTIRKYAQNYGIDLIEGNPFEAENYWIVGLMGWYNADRPATRDSEFLPKYTSLGTPHVWLQRHAFESFKELASKDYKGKKVVFLSHFGLVKEIMNREDLSGNPHMGSLVLDIADVYCFGHSHQRIETTIGKTRVFNAGATYDQKPPYIIFDL